LGGSPDKREKVLSHDGDRKETLIWNDLRKSSAASTDLTSVAVTESSTYSPAFAGSHGLPTVEECGCPPKPLDRHSFSDGGWRPSSAVALLRRMERRTGASAGYAVPQVPRAPARGAPPVLSCLDVDAQATKATISITRTKQHIDLWIFDSEGDSEGP
jgi:hypothetical protein